MTIVYRLILRYLKTFYRTLRVDLPLLLYLLLLLHVYLLFPFLNWVWFWVFLPSSSFFSVLVSWKKYFLNSDHITSITTGEGALRESGRQTKEGNGEKGTKNVWKMHTHVYGKMGKQGCLVLLWLMFSLNQFRPIRSSMQVFEFHITSLPDET